MNPVFTWRSVKGAVDAMDEDTLDKPAGCYPPSSCPEGDENAARFVPFVAMGRRARLHGDKDPVLLAGLPPVGEKV